MSLDFPSIFFEQIPNFEDAIRDEWLITNGIGGFASSTILGINDRKYHALLVASLHPPGERTVVLSKLDEDIKIGNQTFQLGANDFQNNIYPQGFKYLSKFCLNPFPTYTYNTDQFKLAKTIFMPLYQNSIVVYYELNNRSPSDLTVAIYPLVSYRRYHYVIEQPIWLHQTQTGDRVELEFKDPASSTILKAIGGGRFNAQGKWITGLFYREEANRGESSVDESYQPGFFEFTVPKESTSKFVVVTTINKDRNFADKTVNDFGSSIADIETLMAKELEKRQNILSDFYLTNKRLSIDNDLSWLFLAANDFIVKGMDNRRFIIAGYQWFGSWGRDSFVSLPGLMLTTGRFEEAKGVLLDYSSYCRRGLMPNLIDDITGEPMYNTVDGTLWFVHALLQYLKYTGDFNFAKSIWPTLNEIIINHKEGTLNEIHMDSDGLLAHGPQLTWMDTVVDDMPFTPRSGKAIEVQALWYNALRTVEFLAYKFGENQIAQEFTEMAVKAKESFNNKFWNEKQNSLFDVIDGSGNADLSIRPNQIILGGLDFPIIDKERMRPVVNFVQKELLTPAGLRTLSPKDSRYKGKYEGTRPDRDRAYHNGSIWPWLTGPLTTSYLKANGYSSSNVDFAYRNFIQSLLTFGLSKGGLGTLNEINDGDPPYTPRGCIAQAWSVAEPLRAYVEDILQIRPKFENEILAVGALA